MILDCLSRNKLSLARVPSGTPDTITPSPPIQNFQGGEVTLTRVRATVPLAAPSTQRDPKAAESSEE